MAEVLLPVALVGDFRERQRNRGEQRHDGHGDHELDEGEAVLFHRGCGPAAGAGEPSVDGIGGCGAAGVVTGGTEAGDGAAGMTDGSASELPPTSASVPELNSSRFTAGRSMLRTTRGVMSITISVLFAVSSLLWKRRPATGRLASPGTCVELRRSSLLIRPASTCVSPSCSLSTVDVVRVPSW